TRFLEVRLALGVDERGGGIGKTARWIGADAVALGFHEDCPARSKAAEGVVEAAGDRNQLSRYGGGEVGATEARRALEAAILVEDDALCDEGCPGQEVGEARRRAAIFSEVHHRPPHTPRKPGMRRCRRVTSTNIGSRFAAHTAAKWPTA